MISSIFKTRKNKAFNFKPRYYNEAKADLDLRVKAIKKEMAFEENHPNYKASLFQNEWRKKKLVAERKKSNNRIVVIVGMLLLLFYWILK